MIDCQICGVFITLDKGGGGGHCSERGIENSGSSLLQTRISFLFDY